LSLYVTQNAATSVAMFFENSMLSIGAPLRLRRMK
jgi:hypothetical protein